MYLVFLSARYALTVAYPLYSIHSITKLQSVFLKEQGIKLPEGLLILCRSAHSLKIYVHPHNTYDADGLRELLDRQLMVPKVCWALNSFIFVLSMYNLYLFF